jgi:hypothetical protein
MKTSSPLIESVRWDDTSEFVTAVVGRAGVEFALYDSAYSPRMPIVISSETTPRLLGEEYVAWRPSTSLMEQLIGRVTYAIGISRIETVALKSPPLHASDPDSDQGGQMLFIFRPEKWGGVVPRVQIALNIHAQDVHNCYAKRQWGELLISVSRIICKCTA